FFFFFSSRRRHTRFSRDWSSDVCSSDLYHNPVRLEQRGWGASSFVPDIFVPVPNGGLAILVQYSEYYRTSHIPFFKKLNDYLNLVLWATPPVKVGFFLAGNRAGWKPSHLLGFEAFGHSFGDALREEKAWRIEEDALLRLARRVGLIRNVGAEDDVTQEFIERAAHSRALDGLRRAMRVAAQQCLRLKAPALDRAALQVLKGQADKVGTLASKIERLPAINWFPPLAAFHLRDDEARVYTRVFERQSIAMVSGRDAQALRQLSKREILGVGRGTHSTVNRFVTTFPAADDMIAVATALG